MVSQSVSLRQFILGLLARQPMSGYDIKVAQKNLGWLTGIPSFGSLYPALHQLLQDGLVTVEVQTGRDRPSRKVYTITTAGRQALAQWANQPHPATGSLREFVMYLNMAGSLSQEALATHLVQRREQVAGQLAALEQMLDESSKGSDVGRSLVMGFALALAGAELHWLDSTLKNFGVNGT